jgi:CBS domain containing-hemolysin-like protein
VVVGGEPPELTAGTIGLRLAAVIILVLANAFFVAAEFALVSVRQSRLEAAASKGDRTARLVLRTVREINFYISAAQLGITMTSLGLGWIGEVAMATLFDRLFHAVGLKTSVGAEHMVASIVAAYLVLTYLHVVLGEQAPKSWALVSPEKISRFVVLPLRFFATITKPLTWLLNASSNALLRLFGLHGGEESHRVHSPEELRFLVLQSHKSGALDESDTAMLAGVFDFHEKRARDVMRPRTEVAGIPVDATTEEVWAILRRERYSRYPVYQDTLDDVVGVFLAKDFWLYEGNELFELRKFVREPLYIPDTRPAERVLDDLRKTRAHMAVVLDEYGGTAGILTIEDLVEEVIGDINDEYDLATTREAMESNGMLELTGALSLVDARSDYQLMIPDGDWSTLGGYAFAKIGRLPRVGDLAPFPGGELEVVAMDGRRVAAVRVHRRASGNIDRERTRIEGERPPKTERRGRRPGGE